jgi:hypothetical protein
MGLVGVGGDDTTPVGYGDAGLARMTTLDTSAIEERNRNAADSSKLSLRRGLVKIQQMRSRSACSVAWSRGPPPGSTAG